MSRNYIQIINQYTHLIHNTFEEIDVGNDYDIKNIWHKVEMIIEPLLLALNVNNVYILANENLNNNSNDLLSIVVNVGLKRGSVKNLNYNLRSLPKNMLNTKRFIELDQKYYNGFSNKINTRDWKIIFSSNDISYPILIMINVNKKYINIEKSIEIILSILCKYIHSYLTNNYYKIRENKFSTAYRIFSHETGQLISGMDSIRLFYLENPDRLKKLENKKIYDINRDFEGLIKQLYFLGTSSRLLAAEIPTPSKDRFYLFSELLYKWKDTFRLEALKKKISLRIFRPEKNDPNRPPIIADKSLLEQIIYNLMDNAIKYCYRGTNILIDAKKFSLEQNSPYTISVINYGIGIVDNEQIFKMYYRGKNVKSKEGLGIGLYIAQKIAKAHSGQINYTCEKMSDFNIPLLKYLSEHSIKEPFEGVDGISGSEITNINNKILNEVIALDQNGEMKYIPSRLELITSLKIPTYKVTFNVIIPQTGE